MVDRAEYDEQYFSQLATADSISSGRCSLDRAMWVSRVTLTKCVWMLLFPYNFPTETLYP